MLVGEEEGRKLGGPTGVMLGLGLPDSGHWLRAGRFRRIRRFRQATCR